MVMVGAVPMRYRTIAAYTHKYRPPRELLLDGSGIIERVCTSTAHGKGGNAGRRGGGGGGGVMAGKANSANMHRQPVERHVGGVVQKQKKKKKEKVAPNNK